MKVIRRLQGITYWVVDDPKEIRKLVNSNIRKEWESDILDQGEDLEHGTWMSSLSRRKWRLRVVAMKDIKLSDEIMGYRNEKTGYDFGEHLKERRKNLEYEIDRFGAVLWPLVLRGEDHQLMDGYCRYQVFKDRRIMRVYAYIGSM
jgi:hypothetical protein